MEENTDNHLINDLILKNPSIKGMIMLLDRQQTGHKWATTGQTTPEDAATVGKRLQQATTGHNRPTND